MKLMRPVVFSVLLGAGLALAVPNFAPAQPFPFPRPGRVRVVPRPRVPVPRAPVVIHPKSPIKRAPRAVVVRPSRTVRRHRVSPNVYLPPVVFGGVVVVERHSRGRRAYSRDNLVWQEADVLYKEDDWTDLTFDCDTRGTKLWFEVLDGRVQGDWIEIVFRDGEVQAIDFSEKSLRKGLYELIDFGDRRRVDTIRIVARSRSNESTISLWLEDDSRRHRERRR